MLGIHYVAELVSYPEVALVQAVSKEHCEISISTRVKPKLD